MNGLSRVANGLIAAGLLIPASGLAQQKGDGERGIIVKNYDSGKTDGIGVLVKMKSRYDDWAAVDPARLFKKGEAVKIEFRPNFDGYVYIVNVTPGGKKRVLFPFQIENVKETHNAVAAWQTYRVPATDSTIYEFDEEVGVEILQVIMSHDPIRVLDSAIKNPNGELDDSAAAAAAELGAGKSDGNKAGGNKRRSDPSGIVDENVGVVVPQTGPEGVNSRSVKLAPGRDKDEQGSVVAIPDDKGGGKLKPGEFAVFEIRLKHI
jgi:hypothetical protein